MIPMSGFLPSQILGWHSATGSATPIVKRFKRRVTSNPDTHVSIIPSLCASPDSRTRSALADKWYHCRPWCLGKPDENHTKSYVCR